MLPVKIRATIVTASHNEETPIPAFADPGLKTSQSLRSYPGSQPATMRMYTCVYRYNANVRKNQGKCKMEKIESAI